MSVEAAAGAIAILRAAYPRQPFPDDAVAFYARKLADISGPELVAAVDRITNRSTFLPSVAEIRAEVAEARLNLPNIAEAWEIAAYGSLRDAPKPIRDAAEFVGGRWAILHSDNIVAVRAQFREQYTHLREQALLEEAGASVPRQLPGGNRPALPPAPDLGERFYPRPVMARAARELIGKPLDPPTEEEIADAIAIMRPGPLGGDPHEDYLYKAAELVLVHASETT